MITNHRIYKCACKVRGQQHAFTADASGRHTLMADLANAHLLRDASWCVGPVRAGSKKLQARATSNAPGIKKGRLLHRLASRARTRKVRAVNGNPLDARKSNLQSLTKSDVVILNRSPSIKRLIGVRYAAPPRWLKTECTFHSSISIDGKKLHLGSFKTLEEAGAAYDAAAIRLYGGKVTTNRSLGFISEKVRMTKVCRQAARSARARVAEHRAKVTAAKLQVFMAAKTDEERRAAFVSLGSRSKMPDGVIAKSSFAVKPPVP